MPMLTKGQNLYWIDPNDYSVVRLTKLTDFNSPGAPASSVDITDLEETSTMQYDKGLKDPGQATGTVNCTASEASHAALNDLYNDESNVKWAFGFSDGTAAPTADSNGNWELPTTRTFFTFSGFVADFAFNSAVNDVVKTPLVIQRSGEGTWSRKA